MFQSTRVNRKSALALLAALLCLPPCPALAQRDELRKSSPKVFAVGDEQFQGRRVDDLALRLRLGWPLVFLLRAALVWSLVGRVGRTEFLAAGRSSMFGLPATGGT